MFQLKFGDVLSEHTRNELDSLTHELNGFVEEEHNADGTHGVVTAEQVVLQQSPVGEVTDIAFDSARFAASGGATWTVGTGDQIYFRYSRVGQLAFVQFHIQTSAIAAATPDSLIIRLPELHAIPTLKATSATGQFAGMGEWFDTSNSTRGLVEVVAQADNFTGPYPTTSLYLQRYGDDAANIVGFTQWATSANVQVFGTATFLVMPNNIPLPFYGA